MISPFAGFFYSAFNPVLLGMAKYPATKWLSSFFFTHMVVPPNGPLKVVRVMGSVLFLLGIAVFLVCAIQVYSHKFLKRGAVLKGCTGGLDILSTSASALPALASPSFGRDSSLLFCGS